MARDYKSEYENYHSSEKAKKKRAENNAARRKMEKAGKVSKGDGKDVAHKNNRTGDNRMGNLKVQSPSSNRSFKRNTKAGRKA
jgi:lipopolysaccharide export LptBFGC system permease protein LptF